MGPSLTFVYVAQKMVYSLRDAIWVAKGTTARGIRYAVGAGFMAFFCSAPEAGATPPWQHSRQTVMVDQRQPRPYWAQVRPSFEQSLPRSLHYNDSVLSLVASNGLPVADKEAKDKRGATQNSRIVLGKFLDGVKQYQHLIAIFLYGFGGYLCGAGFFHPSSQRQKDGRSQKETS